jgi:hypothetical protein
MVAADAIVPATTAPGSECIEQVVNTWNVKGRYFRDSRCAQHHHRCRRAEPCEAFIQTHMPIVRGAAQDE